MSEVPMASNDPNHRRNLSIPQSIPLRDLNRPSGDEDDSSQNGAQHRRTLSERGRNLLRQRDSPSGGGNWRSSYAPIVEGSPSPSPTSRGLRPMIHNGGEPGNVSHEIDDYSPVEDRSAFQAAIGFAGLSFLGESTPSAKTPSPELGTTSSQRPINTRNLSNPYFPDNDENDGHIVFSPVYEDTARLTDERHLQPMSGLEPTTPTGQREERSSFQSVRFLSPKDASHMSRLGDELQNAEAGIRSSISSRKRSLSPASASPLQRAGTIMRNMSQRVVNLSNEPQVAERAIRRKSSLRQARLEEPFGITPEYGHDGSVSPTASPIEKPPSPIEPTHMPRVRWEIQANPLKGRSLGIFSPNSRLRTKLCDLLVHPATEPFLFLLIVVQTVLLAVDASRNVFIWPRSNKWGTTWIDYALLGLFIIYTIEIIVRVIVSGFIINPTEYSTINRQVGFRKAVINKGKALFALHRQESFKGGTGLSTFEPPQPSILRSLTHANMNPEQSGDSRQQQRVRLAHRAFLRHSFNRLDFVAVVSFWISFLIGIFGIESARHAYVFRMLSCLRILRLLGLTSGTTVRSIRGFPVQSSPCLLTSITR